jgi:hypothetical protein
MAHEIAIDGEGNILLSDRQNHRISRFSEEGQLLNRFGAFGEMIAPVEELEAGGIFSEPHGIAVGPDGSIFVCDRYNFRVQKFTATGEFRLNLYTRGDRNSSRHYVLGVAVDHNLNVYIVDSYQHVVQKYRWFLPWGNSATTFGAPGRTRRE